MGKKRIAVLGLGQFGMSLARELAKLGVEVLAVDASTKKVEDIRDEVAIAAKADVRERRALEELFASPFDVAVVSIGTSLESAIMATLHLKDLGVAEIWAEASTDERATVLERVGATRIISPERDMGRRSAARLANPNLVDFLPLEGDWGVVEADAPDWCIGKTLGDLDLRNEMKLAVIAIRKPDGNVVVVPGAEAPIEDGDCLTVVGREKDLARLTDRK